MSSYATLGVGLDLQFTFREVTNSFPLNDFYFHFIRALPRQNSRFAWRIFNAMTLITTPSRLIIWRLGVSMLSLCFWCSTYWVGSKLCVVKTKPISGQSKRTQTIHWVNQNSKQIHEAGQKCGQTGVDHRFCFSCHWMKKESSFTAAF